MFFMLAQDGAGAEGQSQIAQGAEEAAERAGGVLQDLKSGQLDTQEIIALAQQYLLPVVWAVLILIVAWIIAAIVSRSLRGSLTRAKVDETLARFFSKLARYTVLILGVLFALSKFGINVTGFAAILAAAGFAIGMALSGTLSNFASGVMLLMFRPFKVGDVVNAAGVMGKIHEIELFSVTLDTPDNRRIIVPNGSIYGGTIENITHHATRRVDVPVGVEYSADIDQTRAVLVAAAASVPGRLDDPAPAVVLGDLGDSSVGWTVRVWCNTADYWGVKEAATRAVKMHLDEAGIGIPFPQMDVHVDQAPA